MTPPAPAFRAAVPDDDKALATLIDLAGEGLPTYLWGRLAAPGESAWDVGRARARRETGGFSYRHAVVLAHGTQVVGGLIGYPLDDAPPTTDYSDLPPIFVPLQQLEDLAQGTWYVNAVATFPEFRGRGHGGALMALAERYCAELGRRGVSLIVADTNAGARRLYTQLGYRARASRPMVKEQWRHPGTDWLLMVKDR